ncbi:hypothetical protein LTR36_008137 [Oleoguttula mirabilis]|uniref:SET domain-containing protein n=1 Tax=Oleoguttula mirabilis TaxID=1507867 RepID=A0AAV9J8Y8_9PEZI|nr:hypothetical protein LTR36_008137 [Oleoguttula mirabilis]
MAEPYKITQSEGKGSGVFAISTIPPGTTIMCDTPVLKLPRKLAQYTDEEVFRAFKELDEDSQARVMELHEGHRAFKTKLMRIFKANNFGYERFCVVYPKVSRINHSCVPNAAMNTRENLTTEIVATQPIRKGEEVYITYNGLFEGMTAGRRYRTLRAYYGFECRCPACALPPNDLILSDARRQLISVLDAKIRGFEPPNFHLIDHLTPTTAEQLAMQIRYDRMPLETPLTLPERAAYNLMLAKLLQAEHLTTSVVDAYRNAAYHLAEQMLQHEDIVIVACCQNVQAWMTKAIEAATSINGVESARAKSLGDEWREWQTVDHFKVYNMSRQGNLTDPGFLDGRDFAVRIGMFGPAHCSVLTMTALSRRECRALMQERLQKTSSL